MNCTICGKQGRVDGNTKDAKLWRCVDCGHCYTDVSDIKNNEKYANDYFVEKHTNWFEHPLYEFYDQVYQYISERFENSQTIKILDVGCGQGDFLRYIKGKNRQMELTGIDLADNSEKSIKFIRGDVLTTEIKEKYDVIVSFGTIEHIEEIVKFMAKLSNLMNKDGVIILMTVNENGLVYKIARLMKKVGFEVAYERLYEKHHLNHFNKKTLRKLVNKEGIVIKKQFTHNPPLRSIDVPGKKRIERITQKTAMLAINILSTMTKSQYLQTVIGEKS